MSQRPQTLVVALAFCASCVSAAASAQAGDAEAYQHLAERMDRLFTGQQPRFIESNATPYPSAPEGSSQNMAFTYDNALALTAFVDRGTADDLRRAKLIADALVWSQQHDVLADGRWRQAYWATQNLQDPRNTHPAIPAAFNQCNTGEIAFAAGALLTYFNKVRNLQVANPLDDPNAAYLQAAITAGQFLANRTYDASAPGFFAGFREVAPEITVGVPIASYGTVQTTSTTIRIPLSAFRNRNVNLERLKAISLVFNDASRPTGRITFQAIRFVNPATGAALMVDNYADTNRFVNTLGFGVGAVDQAIFGSDPYGRTIIWNSGDGSIDWWYSLLIANPALSYTRLDAADYTYLELTLSGAVGGERFTVELQGFPLAQALDRTKPTEHNIDAYAFFMRLADVTGNATWRIYAQSAKRFVELMQDPADGKMRVGMDPNGVINQSQLAEDVQSWSVLSLGRVSRYGTGLAWAEQHLQVTSDGFTGFDFGINTANPADAQPDGVWFEGTAHMAVAYQVSGRAGGPDSSAYFLSQLDQAQQTARNANGKGLVAASHDNVTTGFGWGYYPSLHVGATSWYILAKRRVNPFWGAKTDNAVPHDNVAPVLAPVANRMVAEGQAVIFTVSATDADGDALTYAVGSLPRGAAFNATTRTFSWTPGYDQGAPTPYTVTFTATDPDRLAATTTATITVTDVPLTLPVFSAAPGVISPNGDGGVETTTISGTFNHSITSGKILIKNAGGTLVRSFTYSGSRTSIAQVWDGKNNSGVRVPDGAYTATLIGIDAGKSQASRFGTVVVDTLAPIVSRLTDSPDPFRPKNNQSTTISFSLSEASFITLRVYASSNALVRTLAANQSRGAGAQSFIWNGRNDSSVLVAPGTYTYRLWAWDAANNLSQPYPSTGTVTVR